MRESVWSPRGRFPPVRWPACTRRQTIETDQQRARIGGPGIATADVMAGPIEVAQRPRSAAFTIARPAQACEGAATGGSDHRGSAGKGEKLKDPLTGFQKPPASTGADADRQASPEQVQPLAPPAPSKPLWAGGAGAVSPVRRGCGAAARIRSGDIQARTGAPQVSAETSVGHAVGSPGIAQSAAGVDVRRY